MTNHLYKLFFFTFSLALIFPAKQESVHSSRNSKVLSRQKSNAHPSKSFPRLANDNLDDIIIWNEDFETGAENWLIGDGWELTQASYHSPDNSILSSNDNNNLDGYFMLFSPKIALPQIGLNEWLYFTFWLNADIPDYNGDNDEIIDDYYQLDIQAPSDNSAWHISDLESYSDNSFWCGEDEIAVNAAVAPPNQRPFVVGSQPVTIVGCEGVGAAHFADAEAHDVVFLPEIPAELVKRNLGHTTRYSLGAVGRCPGHDGVVEHGGCVERIPRFSLPTVLYLALRFSHACPLGLRRTGG